MFIIDGVQKIAARLMLKEWKVKYSLHPYNVLV
jgi:hypothetical protein